MHKELGQKSHSKFSYDRKETTYVNWNDVNLQILGQNYYHLCAGEKKNTLYTFMVAILDSHTNGLIFGSKFAGSHFIPQGTYQEKKIRYSKRTFNCNF